MVSVCSSDQTFTQKPGAAERRPTDSQPVCLSVCLDKLTLKRKSKKSSEGVKPKQQEEQKSEKVEALEQEES